MDDIDGADAELHALYEDAPCAYLVTSLDGTFLRVNRTFEAWTGLRREDLVGRRKVSQILAPGDRIYFETHLAPLLAMQGEVRAIAVEVVTADGGRLPVFIASAVTMDTASDGAVVRTVLFEARDRRRYERELLEEKRRAEASEARARMLARTLQESLIPPTPPRIPMLDVGAAYRPAGSGDEVGGDFYDVFEMPGGAWAVVLGDVTGKGAAAAVVTALARYTIRAAVMQSTEPRAVLRSLNTALLRGDAERPVTAVFSSITLTSGGEPSISVSTAGNPLPIVVTAEGARPVGRFGTILGVVAEPSLHEEPLTLQPGEALVAYTDGITEARRGAEWFGEERLERSLAAMHGRPAANVATALVDEAVAFQEGYPRDDIAVVVVAAPPSA